MPGALEIVKGRVEKCLPGECPHLVVQGLREALERFVGKKVNIMVEEDTSEE